MNQYKPKPLNFQEENCRIGGDRFRSPEQMRIRTAEITVLFRYIYLFGGIKRRIQEAINFALLYQSPLGYQRANVTELVTK